MFAIISDICVRNNTTKYKKNIVFTFDEWRVWFFIYDDMPPKGAYHHK
jgi:alpha-L-arabinofuranosidase